MVKTSLIAALAATTVLAGGFAYAASQPGDGQAGAMPPGHGAAVKDFGKLSSDGARAYRDVKLARFAIFDGDIGDAKTLAARAEQEFNKAKGDEAVFTKAEAEMRTRTVGKGDAGKPADAQAGAAKATDAGTADIAKPIAWLPVDGMIGLAEDYSAQPAKAQAVAKANDSLAKGDKKGAMDTLKLAGVDLDVVTAVVPLQQAITDAHDAAQLINGGKYYEGSQKLRAIENSTILISDNVAVPAGKAPANAAGAASAKADAAKADAAKPDAPTATK